MTRVLVLLQKVESEAAGSLLKDTKLTTSTQSTERGAGTVGSRLSHQLQVA